MKTIAFLIAALTCTGAFAATAIWTGRADMVTTVTYQQAWRCEYDYLGQKIYRLFQGSCPSSIEVQ